MAQHISLPEIPALIQVSEKPGAVYIALGGKELYVSDTDGNVHLYTGPDWSSMTDGKISSWLATIHLDE